MFGLYFAPVGDPALGPVAFPHRASASEIPEAPFSHHWQDSTHIADEVVTAGIKYEMVRLEVSGFYGTEPDENRWHIDHGPINSWSSRLSFFPARTGRRKCRWEDYDSRAGGIRGRGSRDCVDCVSRPMQGSNWSSRLIWGRNDDAVRATT